MKNNQSELEELRAKVKKQNTVIILFAIYALGVLIVQLYNMFA